MSGESRRLLCTIEENYPNFVDGLGKLSVHFEVFEDGSMAPVNTREMLCETGQLFVTSGFDELKERFQDRLFEARAIPNQKEFRTGDCLYVTNADYCDETKGLMACHVFRSKLPEPDASQLTVDTPPLTRKIFLTHDDKAYGPFDCESQANEDHTYTLKITASTQDFKLAKSAGNVLPAFHVTELDMKQCGSQLRQLKEGSDSYGLLGNVKQLLAGNKTHRDFINTDQLITKYGNMLAGSTNVKGFTKGMVALIRKNCQTSREFQLHPQRFERFLESLNKAAVWGTTRTSLFDDFLKQDIGQQTLRDYIEANKERFFKTEKQQLLKLLKQEQADEKKKIEALRREGKNIEAELIKKRRALDELESRDDVKQAPVVIEQPSDDKELKQLQDRKSKIERDIAKLSDRHDLLRTQQQIQAEIKRLQGQRNEAKDLKIAMEQQQEQVAARLRASNEKLVARLVELKPEVDALSGVRPEKFKPVRDFDVPARLQYSLESKDIDQSRASYIDHIAGRLEELGRKTDYNATANILITLAQSQFTLFSGLPGTGKTSFARLIGQAMGLQRRLLNIPVARGWNSPRDVLGFYNALSQSFNPSASGLYELLAHMQDETDEMAPAILLLDELNLSQPEHYFSPFLQMADQESDRVICTGDPKQPEMVCPTYMRFLGTINQDETVQSLSPRMLDRAAVIEFSDDISVDMLSFTPSEVMTDIDIPAISGADFIQLFTPASYDMPDDISSILMNICSTLRDANPEYGAPVIISHRKLKAIASYFNVASPLIERLPALDYAVSQHIVPLLNGFGEGFGHRLELLLDKLPEEMEQSRRMLQQMIASGKQNLYSYGRGL
ncbi:AAA family ATPase [Endozoicomonadaceae bacterium StTr2]